MSQPVDPAVLAELRDLGGRDLVARLVALFAESAPQLLREARAGLDQGDLEAVRRAAHSLRSSAGNLGALALMEQAAAAEEAALRGQAEDLERMLVDMERALEAVIDRLSREA